MFKFKFVVILIVFELFGDSMCNYNFGFHDRPQTTANPAHQPAYTDFGYDQTSICPPTSIPPNPQGLCCGYDSHTENWIVGGNSTSPEQYPWLALIEYYNIPQKKRMTSCSAFLISSRYLLTAAHCVSGRVLETNNPTHIILGEYDKANEGLDCITADDGSVYCTDGAQRYAIEEIIVHPGYRTKDKDDIALIRLNEFAPYTEYIRSICLTSSDINSVASKDVRLWIAGWGAVNQSVVNETGKWLLTNEYSNVKQHVKIPVWDLEDCRTKFNYSVDHRHVCAGGEIGKDSCAGDSGTALMVRREGRYYAVGLLNYGTRNCGIPMPAVYANVYTYLGWIMSSIRE